jgi:transcriptional regulator with XRE-family HTH domain
MAVTVIDGPGVRVQLEALGLSISDLARHAHMERADVSRALSGHPQQPAMLFRLAQALDELQRERARNGRSQ